MITRRREKNNDDDDKMYGIFSYIFAPIQQTFALSIVEYKDYDITPFTFPK